MEPLANDYRSSLFAVRKRFSEISIIKLFFLVLAVLVAVAFFVVIVESFFEDTALDVSFVWEALFFVLLYLAMLGVIVYLFRKENVSLSPIFQRRARSFSDVFLVLPLMVFSISTAWLIVLGLNLISADVAQAYLDFVESQTVNTPGPASPLYHYLLLFLTLSILPALLEELVFRAGMIERLGRRLGFKAGLIVSAIFFGLLHPFDVIGATVFGVVLGLVYLKTFSLFLPILIHMVNNGLVVLMIFMDDQFLRLEPWDRVEPYTAHAWLGLVLFVVSGAWIYHFIRQNWQLVSIRTPIGHDGQEGAAAM